MRQAIHNLEASKIREVANAGLGRDDVLAFWFGESDEVTPEFIRQAAIDSLQRGETFYAHNLGLPELREAVARYMSAPASARSRRRRIADHLGRRQRADAGGAGAGRCRRRGGGDHAGLAQPDGAAGHHGRTRALRAAGAARPAQWTLDLEALRAAVTPATKLLIVNAPNNPTGWTLSRDEQQAHARPLPQHRHLDPGRRGLRAAVLRADAATAARPASSTSRRPTTGWWWSTASPRAS